MTDLEIDLAVALAWESMPDWKPSRFNNHPTVSPAGFWQWTVASFTNIGEGSWEPVPATSPQIWTKCLGWLLKTGIRIDTHSYNFETQLWTEVSVSGEYAPIGKFASAVIVCFLKAKGKA
jgi:hypothetical protein